MLDQKGGNRWIRFRKAALFWGAALGVVCVLVYWPGVVSLLPGFRAYRDMLPLQRIDHWIGDRLQFRFASAPARSHTQDEKQQKICVIGMTSEGLSEYGAMPWPRTKHAELVTMLRSMGARTVAFDIYFPDMGHTEGNAAFVRACQEAGNVILPRWAVMPDPKPSSGTASDASRGIILQNGGGFRAVRGEDGVFRCELHDADPSIYAAAIDQGHMNVFYDQDMIARRVPVAVGEAGGAEFYLPLGIVTALQSRGLTSDQVTLEQDAIVCGDLRIPVDSSGCVMINYQPFQTSIDVRSVEVRQLEDSVRWLRESGGKAPIEFFSYYDVLKGNVPSNAFKNAVVIIGQTVKGSREDVHATPYGNQFGVFVQAMLIRTALENRFLRPVSKLPTAAATLMLSIALGAVCFSLRFRGSTYVVIGGGSILVAAGVLALYLLLGIMRRFGIVLDASPFLMVIAFNVIGGTASSASRMAREAEVRSREMDMLLLAGQRHVSRWMEDDALETRAIEGAGQIAISASLSLRSPDIVAETFWQAVPCEGCALLMIADGKALSFEHQVFLGFKGDLTHEEAKSVVSRFAWETLQVADAPVVHSRRDAAWPYLKAASNIRNIVGVSIIARGQPLAVVMLFNKCPTAASPGKEVTEDDLHLAMAMRYQSAALLENARRYQLEYAMFEGFASSLAKAVDLRDNYTHGHSARVAELSAGIARKLGLTEAEVEIVHRAATLHDVGKIGVSDAVLNKPGRLSDEEFAMIRAHAANGYEILKTSPSFEALLPAIRNHHERYDGKGYPDRLVGNNIPLIARIIAAADTYDAMTSDRIYRKAMPKESAREELVRCSGTQFDPQVVEALLWHLKTHVEKYRGRVIEDAPTPMLHEDELRELVETTSV